MAKDIWIVCKPADWDALDPADQPWAYAYRNARTGHWATLPTGETVYNIAHTMGQIQGIIDALGVAAHAVYAWEQGPGLDSLDPTEYLTDPDAIVALMKPHEVYDENGDLVSSTPATLENPNWGHVVSGQKVRIFAGGFSDGFSEGFL